MNVSTFNEKQAEPILNLSEKCFSATQLEILRKGTSYVPNIIQHRDTAILNILKQLIKYREVHSHFIFTDHMVFRG